jgi:AcrR family transcriptional regulator
MDASSSYRERKKQHTHEAIEAAALELFAQRGYASTTMGDIAQAADVSLRTVAVHFPTKQDLVFRAKEQVFEGLIASIEQRAAGTGTLEAMQEWLRAYVGAASEVAGSDAKAWERRVLRQRIIDADPELAARARGGVGRIEPILVAGVAADLGMSPDDLAPRIVGAAATGVFQMLSQLGTMEDSPPEARTSQLRIDTAFGYLRGGLGSLPEA